MTVARRGTYAGKDFKGQKFGRLEARAPDPRNKKPGTYWWFMCECGKYRSIRMSNVATGATKSCGCLRGEYLANYRKDIQAYLDMRHALELALTLIDIANPKLGPVLTQIDILARRRQK